MKQAILLKRGDITQEQVDIIVNAANSELRGGGGVDGAIHRAAGSSLMKELDRIRVKLPQRKCETGSCVITPAGDLQSDYVIHAVGPKWSGGGQNEDVLLKGAYLSCLRLAEEKEAESIAFPSISTGIYGYPIDQAASIALSTVDEYLNSHPDSSIQDVRFILFSESDFEVYQNALEDL